MSNIINSKLFEYKAEHLNKKTNWRWFN